VNHGKIARCPKDREKKALEDYEGKEAGKDREEEGQKFTLVIGPFPSIKRLPDAGDLLEEIGIINSMPDPARKVSFARDP
jgi:hypothetical protein